MQRLRKIGKDTIAELRTDERGATAVVFGITLLPVLLSVGAALDYSRAASTRVSMQRAVDAAALAVSRDSGGLDDKAAETRGRQFFAANFPDTDAEMAPVIVTRDKKTVRVAAAGTVPSSFLQVFGIKTIPIASEATVGWGTRKVELALVLDNTGSMGEALGGGRKIDELRKAALDVVDRAEKAALQAGDFKISVVPFDTQVKVGNVLPLLDVDFGFGVKQTDWKGCVMDRSEAGNYDVSDAPPQLAIKTSLFPGVACPPSLAQLRPLTDNYAALRSTIKSMDPVGCTNITIGATWGLKTLSEASPLGGGVPYGTADVDKYMVVLTDGDNTKNRAVATSGCGGGGSSAKIDERTRAACETAKAAGVKVFTVLVGSGNAKLLSDCAGNGGTYQKVSDATQLTGTFKKIFDDILSIRLTR